MGERFGSIARDARMLARIPLRRIAEELGYTIAHISDIERGQRSAPPPLVVRRWATLVDVDPDRFERLALFDRRAFELPVDRENATATRNEAAFALARAWNELSDDDYATILDIAQRRQRQG